MRLVVFGATGGIGMQVVQQTLERGHEVTVVARQPSALTIKHRCLEIVKGDVLDAATLQGPVTNKDVVISALGARDSGPTTIYSQGVANIIAAMQSAHVSRLFCVSASGLEPGPLWQRWIAKPLLWLFLKNSYSDLVRMEDVVRRSSVIWTILRLPRLTNGPRVGQYQIAVNKHLQRGMQLSRADVADYIVRHLDDVAAHNALVEIAY